MHYALQLASRNSVALYDDQPLRMLQRQAQLVRTTSAHIRPGSPSSPCACLCAFVLVCGWVAGVAGSGNEGSMATWAVETHAQLGG